MTFHPHSYLAQAVDRDFERAVLPFFAIVFPGIAMPKALAYWDRRGVDLMTGPHVRPIAICVQCKSTGDEDFGDAALQTFLKDIDKFIAAKVNCARYILALNRKDKHRRVADAVAAHLTGQSLTFNVEVWDFDRIIDEAYAAMRRLIQERVSVFNAEWEEKLVGRFAPSGSWVRRVPAKTYRLLLGQTGDPEIRDQKELSDIDVAELILDPKRPRMNLLVGHFGAGKTSAALLASKSPGHTVIYVPASALNGVAARTGTSGLTREIARALGVRPLMGEPDKIFDFFLGRSLTQILVSERQLVLIIDGLDENQYMRSFDSLKLIRNQLAKTVCRIVLSTRTEHLAIRGGDFSTAFSDRGHIGNTGSGMRIIELKAWTEETSRRHVQTIAARSKAKSKMRLLDLESMIGDGRAKAYYGDLLTHPIFLDLIIDDVAAASVRHVDRSALIKSWIVRKIRRDQAKYDSALLGGDTTEEARLILAGLEDIALEMADPDTLRPKGSLSYGKMVDLLGRRGLDQASVFELLLKSVLFSVGQRTVSQDAAVIFSHQVFFEYLVASALIREGRRPPPAAPAEIISLFDELVAGDTRAALGTALSMLGAP